MKRFNIIKTLSFFLAVTVLLSACERELSEDANYATYPTTAEMFTDTFVGMGADFFFPYSDGYAKAEVLSVDNQESYDGSSSMRIDVPHVSDPEGSYAGAFFQVDGGARNLTGYNALTFWAKSSHSATLEKIGFGQGVSSMYQVGGSINVDPTWRKYFIPIPNPSRLFAEAGMFWIVATDNEETGYALWFDEIKFENMPTLGNPQPKIQGGADQFISSFPGASYTVAADNMILSGTYAASDGHGNTMMVDASNAYFDWSSSDPSVVSVNGMGEVTIHGGGQAVITASVNGVPAQGSLTIKTIDFAPTPTRPAENVVSVFSDSYTNATVDFYNGFWAPYQTTLGGQVNAASENIINYTNLNFVGISTQSNPVNASGMTYLHIDINVQEAINSGDFFKLELQNDVGGSVSSGSYTIPGSSLAEQQWASFDIPMSAFGLADQSKIGLYIISTDATISNVILDNIYFFNE